MLKLISVWLAFSVAAVQAQASLIGSAPVKVDGSTIESSASGLRVKDLGITSGKLNSNVVDGSTIEHNSGVLRVKDGGITAGKLAAVNYSISSGSSTFSTSSTSYVDATNLSVTITSSGRPAMVFMQSDGSTNDGYIGIGNNAAVNAFGSISINEGATILGISKFQLYTSGIATPAIMGLNPCSSVSLLIFPTAGAHTYKIQAKANDAATYLRIYYCKLVVREL